MSQANGSPDSYQVSISKKVADEIREVIEKARLAGKKKVALTALRLIDNDFAPILPVLANAVFIGPKPNADVMLPLLNQSPFNSPYMIISPWCFSRKSSC